MPKLALTQENRSQEISSAKRKEVKISLKRFFTKEGAHPFDQVQWKTVKVMIKGSGMNNFGEERELEFPEFWSDNAISIAGSKYLRGRVGSPEREQSAKQMISRVAGTIRGWGLSSGYFDTKEEADLFADELTHILLHQKAAFNSPVWFNVGVANPPQCSACQPYRALVSTPAGFYSIGEIVEKQLVGLPVYDSQGITHVVAVKNNGVKTVYKAIVRNGAQIEATGDHLVRAVHARRTEPQWVRMDELCAGMRLHLYPHREILAQGFVLSSLQNQGVIAYAGSTLVQARATPIIALTSQLEISKAALAGWLQADGFVGQYAKGTNTSLTIEFLAVTHEEQAWIEGHLDVVFPNVHRKLRVTYTKKGTPITRIRLYGEVVRPFVEEYRLLQRREKIQVPAVVWHSAPEVIAAYLRSVFQSEGFVARSGNSVRIGMATISEDWMRGVQTLLFGMGIYSRLFEKREKRVDRSNLFEIDISVGSEREKFAKRIGFLSCRKQEKLHATLLLKGQKHIPDLREEEIVHIEKGKDEVVYDIQTLSGEYLSNNVAVHNCFILSIEDSLESIMNWINTEGMIFKRGSGAGINLSTLRGSKETLSRGGHSSGPVSFMRGADAVAGTIASGGATRRAAKMVVLNVDHPDVMKFIRAKAEEEKKVRALISAGYDMYDLNNDAWNSIQYQNANNSVRVTDEFMHAVENDEKFHTRFVQSKETADEYSARELMREIAQAAWECGDPGMQYDTTINRWHTASNTGRINASNPCFTGDTRVATDKGLIRFDDLFLRTSRGEQFRVFTHNTTAKVHPSDTLASSVPTRVAMTGVNEVYELMFSNGMNIHATKNHRFFTRNRGMVAAEELIAEDEVIISRETMSFDSSLLALPYEAAAMYMAGWGGRQTKAYKPIKLPTIWTVPLAHYMGYLVGDGSLRLADKKSRLSAVSVIFGDKEEAEELTPQFTTLFQEWGVHEWQYLAMPNGTLQLRIHRTPVARMLHALGVSEKKAPYKTVPHAVFEAPQAIQAGFLRGLFTADGCVYDGEKSRYVGLGSASRELLSGVQQMLLSQGIFSRIYEARKPQSSFSYIRKNGSQISYVSHQMYDLRITGKSVLRFKEIIGFLTERKQSKLARMIARHDFYDTDDHGVYLIDRRHAGREFTYNLTEPINHSYIANGLVVANCSEYMHLDDSACNLASINLLKYLHTDGSFKIRDFTHTVDVMILAQEIIVDASSYPTEKIKQNAHAFRQLGLGYANLGALLMASGIPYDSDTARHSAAAITALMCGEAYRYSGEIAKRMGPFEGYQVNKEPMQKVIEMHGDMMKRVRGSLLFDPKLYEAAVKVWESAFSLGKKYGVRNSQVTVLAPTGTIALMMDCATTGIEPEFALVKMKKLVGGGLMKFVNTTVPQALEKLGYVKEDREGIVDYVEKTGMIEGAPGLKDEHLAVFDCAIKPQSGKRAISWKGHVKMVAAAQSFISGAISKTFNMPSETTPEEIMDAYMMGWKLGLKAFAVYRDGSKAAQPLNLIERGTKKEEKEQKPTRRRFPATRPSETHKFSIAGHEGYLTYSMYENGEVGEIFICMSKQGSTLAGLIEALGVTVSIALQYGVPLKTLVRKFAYWRFEPAGYTENPDIQVASSITDYIFRYLALRFLPESDLDEIGVKAPVKEIETAVKVVENPAQKTATPVEAHIVAPLSDTIPRPTLIFAGIICRTCGGMMIQTGTCKTCVQCGSSNGGC